VTDIQNTAVTPVASDERPESREPLGLVFWVCVGWLTLTVVAALVGPFLPLQDPNAVDPSFNIAMSWSHPLGIDQSGRDIFSRLILGSRTSIVISIGAMAIGFGIGGTLGMFAAYKRGLFDLVTSALTFTLLAFPSIIGIIAVLTVWTPVALGKITIVIGVTSIPLVYRVIRAATLATASKEYVTAAKVMGARDSRIMLR